MNFRLRVWRQPNAKARGKLVDYEARDISPNTSFLEMLDILNDNLLGRGEEPRNLRHLFAYHQRGSARTRPSRRGLRTLHEKIS